MHHSITKALYEMFPREEKGDFFHAYLYLKHLNHFMYHALKASGSKPKQPESDLGDDVDDLLEAMVQSIAENAASRDTSTYHAKVLQAQGRAATRKPETEHLLRAVRKGDSLRAGPEPHLAEPRIHRRRGMRLPRRRR